MASTANTHQVLPVLAVTPQQPIIRKRITFDNGDPSPLREKLSPIKSSIQSNSTSHPILTRLSPTGRDSRRSNKSPSQRSTPTVGLSKAIRVNLMSSQQREPVENSPEQRPATIVSFDIKEIKEESGVKEEANTLLSIIKEVSGAIEKQASSMNALKDSSLVKSKEVKENKEKEHKEKHTGEHKTQINHIITILKKDYEDRSEEDLERLAALVSDITFFKNLETTRGRARLLKCLARLTYSKFTKGTKVFSQGEPGTTYHIILRGSVKVTKASWVKAEQEALPGGDQINENEEVKPEGETLNRSDSSINGAAPPPEEEVPVKTTKRNRKKTVVDKSNTRITMESQKKVVQVLVSSDVADLHAGETFGEVALITNKPRGATVTAIEDCDFAVLEKLDFDRILSEYEEKLLEQKLSFLNSMKMFTGWNYPLLTRLYYHLRHQKFTFNTPIYKEGTKANRVYILRKGELTVCRRIKVNETEKIHKMHMLSKKPVYKDLAITVVGPMEMLGEEDILSSGIYSNTVICSSAEAEIMSMSRRDFINHVWGEEGAKFYLKTSTKAKLKNYEERAKEIQASWADKKGLLYSTTPVALQLTRKPSGVNDIYNRLEQFYQTPDLDRVQEQDSPDQSDFDPQSNQRMIATADTPNILEFLDRKSSQSPILVRTASQQREPGGAFNFQIKQRQTNNLSPISPQPKDRSLGLEKNGSIPKREVFTFSSEDHSPVTNYSPPINGGFAEMLSPIRNPQSPTKSPRSFVLSDGNKESPSFLKHQKDNELAPEDDHFSLEAKSKDGSGANTMRMIGLNVNPHPIQPIQSIQVYKKNTQIIIDERDSPGDLSARMRDLAKTGSLVRLPTKTYTRMDSDRTKSIPRIRVAGLTHSQLQEKRQNQTFESTPGLPVNFTVGDVASPIRVHNESYRPQSEADTLDEKPKNVHPKVKMLGSLRTRLRVGIIKYQGLQKHLETPDEMERENISRNLIMKQIDENKQTMRLVYGTKLFTDIRKDITRKFYENKKRKEQVMPPNLINEAMRDYLRTLATEQGATPMSKQTDQLTVAATEPVNLDDYRKDPKKFNGLSLSPIRSVSEPPAQKKKPDRARSSFLNRQLNFAQEVEQETQKMYKKIYGKLVTKKLLDNVES